MWSKLLWHLGQKRNGRTRQVNDRLGLGTRGRTRSDRRLFRWKEISGPRREITLHVPPHWRPHAVRMLGARTRRLHGPPLHHVARARQRRELENPPLPGRPH